MASNYTNLGVQLMTTGEKAGTWGTLTNTNWNIIEQIAAKMKIAAFDAQNRTQAPVVRDRLRDMLGNQWIKDTLRESIKDGRTSFPLFADKFNKFRPVESTMYTPKP